MKAYLRTLLTPWTQPDPLTRAACCASSIVMLLSVTLLFTSKVEKLLLVALAIFIPLVAVSMLKAHRNMKTEADRFHRLTLVDAVESGAVRIDELPGNVQEDIRLELARLRLERDDT